MSRRNTIPTSQESTESILHKSCQVDCDGTIFPTKITEVKHGRRNEIVGVTVGYEDASSEIIDHWPPSFVTFDDDDPMNLPLQSEDNIERLERLQKQQTTDPGDFGPAYKPRNR